MKKIITAAVLSVIPVVAMAGVQDAFNQIGIYGQAVDNNANLSVSDPNGSVSANGGNTVGGLGVTASGVNQSLWYTHLGFNYGFGSPINGGNATASDSNGSASASGSANGYVNGHSLQFNLRIGKLFSVAPSMAVGPYLAYQYAGFSVGVNNIGTATYDNNAIGGGVEAGAELGSSIGLTGHIGYLAGVSATANAGGVSANNTPDADDLQIGAKASYAITSNAAIFVGIDYDRYSASDSYAPDAITGSATINQVRGLAGVSYLY